MNEQDLINTLFNMMVDKTYGSLMPFGLSSDLDDLAEDTVLEPNKIRKVGDINNWRFETLPGVQQGEEAMLNQALSFIRENSSIDQSSASSPQGGKVTMRQAVLKQQEVMAKLGFTINYLEDFERDRTELRISHLLQFYSIPRIEKITGSNGKDLEKLTYRDISIPDSKLKSGDVGTKIIQLYNNEATSTPDKKKKLQDEMAKKEAISHMNGTKAETLGINVDSFMNYNYRIQVVKNSSYEHNQMLDRAERMELANWLLSMKEQGVNVDEEAVAKYVLASYDADPTQFIQKGGAPQQGAPGQPGQGGQGAPAAPKVQPGKMFAPGNQLNPQMMLGGQ